MADFVSHPLDRASAEFALLSKPHEYWRWRDHTTTYSEFKKEMWAKVPLRDRVPGGLNVGQESECGTGIYRVGPTKEGTVPHLQRADGQAQSDLSSSQSCWR